MYLWVMNYVKARGWDIASVVKNLPSDKDEGVKALPFPEGGMVNAKFEAHIMRNQSERNLRLRTFKEFSIYQNRTHKQILPYS